MGCPDAGAGEHGDGRFRHHRHVKRHEITLGDTHSLQRIGGFAHLRMQLPVGEPTHITGFSFPDQGCLVSLWAIQVTVEAVVGEVRGSPFEPAGEGSLRPVQNGVERFEPVEFAAGGIPPEAIGIILGGIRQGAISLKAANTGLCSHLGRRIEHPLLLQHAFDRRVGVGHNKG